MDYSLLAEDKHEILYMMADTFRNVLLLLPQKPSNLEQYQDFLNRTIDYATKPPFNMPSMPKLAGVVNNPIKVSFSLCTTVCALWERWSKRTLTQM